MPSGHGSRHLTSLAASPSRPLGGGEASEASRVLRRTFAASQWAQKVRGFTGLCLRAFFTRLRHPT